MGVVSGTSFLRPREQLRVDLPCRTENKGKSRILPPILIAERWKGIKKVVKSENTHFSIRHPQRRERYSMWRNERWDRRSEGQLYDLSRIREFTTPRTSTISPGETTTKTSRKIPFYARSVPFPAHTHKSPMNLNSSMVLLFFRISI